MYSTNDINTISHITMLTCHWLTFGDIDLVTLVKTDIIVEIL